MKYQIVIACFLLIASAVHGKDQPNSAVTDKPEILFLLGGQSNMAGNGFTKDLPKTPEYDGYRSFPGNVSIWDGKGKKWTPLEIGSRFGPEIGFAHTLSSALPGNLYSQIPGSRWHRSFNWFSGAALNKFKMRTRG